MREIRLLGSEGGATLFDFVIFKLTFSRIFADLTLSSNGEAILNPKNIVKSRRAP
jgi:hypothetical protein